MRHDPTIALAISVHAAPGVYALLVGSGISKAALVPTGWDVVNDLVARAATASGQQVDDPFEWYRSNHGSDPDYSTLLEQLAPMPAERRNLLSAYFEPSQDDDPDRGAPTAAHRAIAQLVADKRVRVIVTTNFDRLLETALRDVGVEAAVITGAAAAAGAGPLVHTPCTIIKVHGDYLEPNIRNTVNELNGYEPAIDTILDTVFDDYGLIIAGWSGDWDPALRDAIRRAPNRRYSTYWTHVGELSTSAAEIVAHRDATTVSIDSADDFFTDLVERLVSLDDLADTPLSTDLAIAELKRYIPEERHRIRLHDLIDHEISALDHLKRLEMSSPQTSSPLDRLRYLDQQCDRLCAMTANLATFADNLRHDRLVTSILERLAKHHHQNSGADQMLDLQRYPALLAFYSAGIASLAVGRFDPLETATTIQLPHFHTTRSFLEAVSVWRVLDRDLAAAALGRTNYISPASHYMFDRLREPLRSVIGDDDQYESVFDAFEFIVGVLITATEGGGPFGRITQEAVYGEYRPSELAEHREALEKLTGGSAKLDESIETHSRRIREAHIYN